MSLSNSVNDERSDGFVTFAEGMTRQARDLEVTNGRMNDVEVGLTKETANRKAGDQHLFGQVQRAMDHSNETRDIVRSEVRELRDDLHDAEEKFDGGIDGLRGGIEGIAQNVQLLPEQFRDAFDELFVFLKTSANQQNGNSNNENGNSISEADEKPGRVRDGERSIEFGSERLALLDESATALGISTTSFVVNVVDMFFRMQKWLDGPGAKIETPVGGKSMSQWSADEKKKLRPGMKAAVEGLVNNVRSMPGRSKGRPRKTAR